MIDWLILCFISFLFIAVHCVIHHSVDCIFACLLDLTIIELELEWCCNPWQISNSNARWQSTSKSCCSHNIDHWPVTTCDGLWIFVSICGSPFETFVDTEWQRAQTKLLVRQGPLSDSDWGVSRRVFVFVCNCVISYKY